MKNKILIDKDYCSYPIWSKDRSQYDGGYNLHYDDFEFDNETISLLMQYDKLWETNNNDIIRKCNNLDLVIENFRFYLVDHIQSKHPELDVYPKLEERAKIINDIETEIAQGI